MIMVIQCLTFVFGVFNYQHVEISVDRSQSLCSWLMILLGFDRDFTLANPKECCKEHEKEIAGEILQLPWVKILAEDLSDLKVRSLLSPLDL